MADKPTFDPDAFMAKRQAPAAESSFDPDAFMSSRSTPGADKGLPAGSLVSPSKSLPPSLNTIYTPPLRESGFFSGDGFGPGTLGKGIGEAIQPGSRMEGVHHVLVGAGETVSPALVPSLLSAPLSTLAGLFGAGAGGAIGKYGSRSIGAPDDVSDLIGDASSIGGGVAAGKIGSLASDLFQNPAVRAAAIRVIPRGDKIHSLATAIHDSFRTPESGIVSPSVTGVSTRPDYSPLLRPAASGEPYQSTITPEPGPGLWSQLPVKSPRIVPVHPSTPPLFEPLEGGPGFSGTQLPGSTGTGGNPQTPPPLLRNPRAPVAGIPDARDYTFSGGNQFRIPRLIDPATAKPASTSGETLPVTNSGIVRLGQTPAERIQTLSNSPEGTLGTRAEMMRQLRLSDIHGTTDPSRAAIIRRFESPEYNPRPDRTFIDPRESEIMAPKPVTVSPEKDTPSSVRGRVNSSRAKFDENGKRNQLK